MGGIQGHQEQKSYASYIDCLIGCDPKDFERFGELVGTYMWTYSARTNQYGAIINARGFEAEVPGNACNA